jgi:phosphatidylserine/phosphatidylglycerophosphate/cardiolipin synthase-like enzyme
MAGVIAFGSGLDLLDERVMAALLLAVAAVHAVLALRGYLQHDPIVLAHFSPKGGCTAAIVAELTAARSEILVMAYSFSCRDIASALAAAAARGVRVTVLLDRSNEAESYSELGDLGQHRIEVLIDACHAIAHNKVIVIDRRTVVTGSFNFTRQAEHENAENLLILRHQSALAARYRDNFQVHKEHCRAPAERVHTPTGQHEHARFGRHA